MSACSTCMFWFYRYPDDMGVCNHTSGPENVEGFAVPIKSAVLSKETKQRFAGKQATSSDSTCDRYVGGVSALRSR